MEAAVFFIIFGLAVLLAAGILALSKNPKKSVLTYRVHNLRQMTDDEARPYARRLAKVLALTALGPILGGLAGLFSGAAMVVVLLGGTAFFLWLGVRLWFR